MGLAQLRTDRTSKASPATFCTMLNVQILECSFHISVSGEWRAKKEGEGNTNFWET
jgi:hypothetical protein